MRTHGRLLQAMTQRVTAADGIGRLAFMRLWRTAQPTPMIDSASGKPHGASGGRREQGDDLSDIIGANLLRLDGQ